MIGRDEPLSDREISESPFTCIYVWYEKSTTLREVMSLLAVENVDLIPRSVSMSVKSVFVRPSSGKLAHKDLGMVFNFKISKEEKKTLGELGLNIGDSLWVNTVKGYPQKSILGSCRPAGSSRPLPRAQVLNTTVQSKDFGIVNRSRVAPYERSGQDRMEFRSNRTRTYNREYLSRKERDGKNGREGRSDRDGRGERSEREERDGQNGRNERNEKNEREGREGRDERDERGDDERMYDDKRHPDRIHPDRRHPDRIEVKHSSEKKHYKDENDAGKKQDKSRMDNHESLSKSPKDKEQGDGW